MYIYRGYVRLKGKSAGEGSKLPAQKLKNADGTPATYLTYEQVKVFDTYAGVLGENTVVLDVDEMDAAERLLRFIQDYNTSEEDNKDNQIKTYVLKTDRGMHFYFANNGEMDKCRTKYMIAIGLLADFKIGVKIAIDAIKMEGKDPRPVIYDTATHLSNGEVELSTIPKWFQPVKQNAHSFTHSFCDGEAMEGNRNDTLFRYILTLRNSGFSKEDIQSIIGIINSYILETPLSADEIATIVRDEAIPESKQADNSEKCKKGSEFFTDKGFFLIDNYVHFLINEYHIKKINGSLHVYDGKTYVTGKDCIEGCILDTLSNTTVSRRNEIRAMLEVIYNRSHQMESQVDKDHICFNNGLYSISKKCLVPHNPDIITTNCIPWDYDPNAYDKDNDKVLNKLAVNNIEIRHLIEEAIGICFYKPSQLARLIIIVGETHNGKSTFFNMLKHVLGIGNYSSLQLKELSARFKTARLSGVLANIGDDIDEEYIPDTSVLKKLTTGEDVTAENKGETPYTFRSYAKLLFSANVVPRIGSGNDWAAVKRRLLIIPFNAVISKTDPDYMPFIEDILLTEQGAQYLINVGLKGLHRILDNKGFTNCEICDNALKQIEENNNPLYNFLQDCEADDYNIINAATSTVYDKYKLYCVKSGYKACAINEFTRRVKRELHCDTKRMRIPGRSERPYVFVRTNETPMTK